MEVNANPKVVYNSDTFDAFSKEFYSEANDFAKKSIEHISNYESLPVPDGSFYDHIKILVSLPLPKEVSPTISKLIRKRDPYLQEAGVQLATALCRNQYVDYSEFEIDLIKVLSNPNLDPWVMQAVHFYAGESFLNSKENDPVLFYAKFAEIAYLGNKTFNIDYGPSVLRSRGITPYLDAQALIEYQLWMGLKHSKTPGKLSEKNKALLPYFAKHNNYKNLKPVIEHFQKIEDPRSIRTLR